MNLRRDDEGEGDSMICVSPLCMLLFTDCMSSFTPPSPFVGPKKHPLVVTIHSLLSLHQGSHKSLYRFAYSRQCRYMEILNMCGFFVCVIGFCHLHTVFKVYPWWHVLEFCYFLWLNDIPFIYTLHFVYSFV